MINRFVSGGGLGAVKLIAGFVRVKMLAIAIGVAGLGILAQAVQFNLVAIALTSISLAVGIINRIRQPARLGDPEAERITRGTAFVSLLGLIGLYTFVVSWNATFILDTVFRGTISRWQILPVLMGVPFSVIASGYIEGIFYSRDRYDLYVKASMMAALIELGLYVGLVYARGISGALFALGISSATLLASYLWYLRKIGDSWRNVFPIVFDLHEFVVLFRFGAVMLATTALGYLCVLYVRSEMLALYGARANGLLQVALAFSAYSLPFITNGVWGHLHPMASKLGDTPEVRKELLGVLRVVMILSSLASLGALCLPDVLISIAYTNAFIDATRFFPAQFVGDFFYFFAFTLGVFFLATSQLRTYMAGWIAYYAIYLIGSKILFPYIGPLAPAAAHALASCTIAACGAVWLLLVAQIGFRQLALFWIGTFMVGAAALLLWYETPLWVRLSYMLAPVLMYGKLFLDWRKSTRERQWLAAS
ncbi:hypothetical protein GCM10009105_07660 [Dokdonella soli]|uniref:Lipopolysaccharide biosynthesis protein n=1 Tax=Dokdonella soli TaxID=529810 RepID=A0ABN1ID63_9GAMM